jgi:hypothetical protein
MITALAPLIVHASPRAQIGLLTGAASGLLVCFAAAALTAGFDENRPMPVRLIYLLDVASGEALWASQDREASPWLRGFVDPERPRRDLEHFMPRLNSQFLTGPARPAPLHPPGIEVLSEPPAGGPREYELRVTPPPRASAVEIHAIEANVSNVRVDERRVESADGLYGLRRDGAWGLQFLAPPPDGFLLAFRLGRAGRACFRVVAQYPGLPSGIMPAPWPPDAIPSVFASDLSFAVDTVCIEGESSEAD